MTHKSIPTKWKIGLKVYYVVLGTKIHQELMLQLFSMGLLEPVRAHLDGGQWLT